MLNATSWTRFKHDFLAPTDALSPLGVERRFAFSRLALQKSERLLLVGRNPAADLALVPKTARGVVGGFGTPAIDMLDLERDGFAPCRLDPTGFELPDEAFDVVALHGALENVEDPALCLAEAARVVRPGGRISILDRFLPAGFRPPLWHRVATRQVDVVFRAAELAFEEILERSGAPLEPISDEACPPPSAMRVVICRKPERAREWTPLAGSWIAQAFAGAAVVAAAPA